MKNYFKFLLLSLCVGMIACSSDDDSPNPPQQDNHISFTGDDLNGTWTLKGNSSTMAIISLNTKTGEYRLVEYETPSSNYVFRGWYSGDIKFTSDYKTTSIEFDKADQYLPSIKEGLFFEYDDDISRQHSFRKSFTIECLNEEKTKMRLSSGDSFFEATKSTEFISGYNSPTVGPSDFANLGLSVHWAKCNIGATKAEGYGLYVGWADPTGTKVSTNLADYPAVRDSDVPTTICGSKYDIAKQKWGDKWRMPTLKQMNELEYYCQYEEITVNGIRGSKYTGITGESIFLPCAGFREGNSMQDVGGSFAYWSGDLCPWGSAYGRFWGRFAGWYADRYMGCQVRAVCDK